MRKLIILLNLLNCTSWLAELSNLAASNGWTAIKDLVNSAVFIKLALMLIKFLDGVIFANKSLSN